MLCYIDSGYIELLLQIGHICFVVSSTKFKILWDTLVTPLLLHAAPYYSAVIPNPAPNAFPASCCSWQPSSCLCSHLCCSCHDHCPCCHWCPHCPLHPCPAFTALATPAAPVPAARGTSAAPLLLYCSAPAAPNAAPASAALATIAHGTHHAPSSAAAAHSSLAPICLHPPCQSCCPTCPCATTPSCTIVGLLAGCPPVQGGPPHLVAPFFFGGGHSSSEGSSMWAVAWCGQAVGGGMGSNMGSGGPWAAVAPPPVAPTP